MDETFRMTPPVSLSAMARPKTCAGNSAPPKRLRPMTRSSALKGRSKKASSGEVVASLRLPPAALTRMSMSPALLKAASSDERCMTSTGVLSARRPSLSRSSATVCARSWAMSAIQTFAPAWASVRAKTAPSTPAPPVIRAVFPSSRNWSRTLPIVCLDFRGLRSRLPSPLQAADHAV